MMTARTLSWTAGAQARRVATVDARSTGIDAAYGLFYVLAGFFLSPPGPHRAVHVAVAPFIALSLVLVYLAFRLCGPESEDKTAMFYANLPRPRTLSYWVHAAWLGLFALALEAVIMLGVALRLGAARPDLPLVLAPYMFVLPFFTIAFMMWLVYHRRNGFIDVPAVLAATVAPAGLITWGFQLRIHNSLNGRYSVTMLALALLTGLLLWHGSRLWTNTQVGEAS